MESNGLVKVYCVQITQIWNKNLNKDVSKEGKKALYSSPLLLLEKKIFRISNFHKKMKKWKNEKMKKKKDKKTKGKVNR